MTAAQPGAALRRVLDALDARGFKYRGGAGRYRAQCPAHDGHDLNLSVAAGDQGVLIQCHSHQCTAADVATALGLTVADLFDNRREATYDYGHGHIVHRTRTATGKRIRQDGAPKTPALTGLWTPPGSTPIAESRTVLLAEGEKTADALVRMGAPCAASWPGGAGGVGRVDLAPLAGRTVVICPDNDGPGQDAAAKLRAMLAGVAADIHVWATPAKYDGYPLNDPADLWTVGGTLNDLHPTDATTGAPNGAPEPEPDVDAGTWAPVDVAAIIDGIRSGKIDRPTPTVLCRDDGAGLLYPGKVNGIHGDSGSGKTWAALHASAQVIAAGGTAAYVDMEDSPASVLGRLLALGVPPGDAAARFLYVQPETPFTDAADGFLTMVREKAVRLVVIDSVGESMGLEGVNPNADDEVTAWFRTVPRLIARQGPAVLILDHMPKAPGSDLWAIGSQRKRAAIDGAQYLQEVMSPFSREKAGAARLICAKDRNGTYARNQRVAVLHVTPGTDTVRITLQAADPATDAGGFRPTGYMEKVSRALENAPEPVSYRGILDRVDGKHAHIRAAVDALIEDGYVSTTSGPRNSTMHHSVKPYRERTGGATLNTNTVPKTTVDCSRSLGGETGNSHSTVAGQQSGNSGEQSSDGAES